MFLNSTLALKLLLTFLSFLMFFYIFSDDFLSIINAKFKFSISKYFIAFTIVIALFSVSTLMLTTAFNFITGMLLATLAIFVGIKGYRYLYLLGVVFLVLSLISFIGANSEIQNSYANMFFYCWVTATIGKIISEVLYE